MFNYFISIFISHWLFLSIIQTARNHLIKWVTSFGFLCDKKNKKICSNQTMKKKKKNFDAREMILRDEFHFNNHQASNRNNTTWVCLDFSLISVLSAHSFDSPYGLLLNALSFYGTSDGEDLVYLRLFGCKLNLIFFWPCLTDHFDFDLAPVRVCRCYLL